MEKIIGTYSFTYDCGIAVVGIEYGVDDVVLYFVGRVFVTARAVAHISRRAPGAFTLMRS